MQAAIRAAVDHVTLAVPREYPEGHFCKALGIELNTRTNLLVSHEVSLPSWFTDSTGKEHKLCNDRIDFVVRDSTTNEVALLEVKHSAFSMRQQTEAIQQLHRYYRNFINLTDPFSFEMVSASTILLLLINFDTRCDHDSVVLEVPRPSIGSLE